MRPVSTEVTIINRTRGVTVAHDVEVATSFWKRGIGLMGRSTLANGFGLVIYPCGSIHMFFMRVPIDVLHVDKHGKVVRILHAIKPWRLGPLVRHGKWVIELPAHTAAQTQTELGDHIEVCARAEVLLPRRPQEQTR